MVDIHSANRRFERFLMSHGYDPTEPPDDRKTLDDMYRYPRRRQHAFNGQRLEYIRQLISILSQRSNDTSLLQDYLAETKEEINTLKRKKNAMMNEYVSKVKNPLIGYESLWGSEAIRGLSGPTKTDEEWRGWSHYRELFFKDLKYKSKLRKISDKISALGKSYDITLNRIKANVQKTH